MKNLIKNSTLGLMLVAVAGTQVQAVSMAMVQARGAQLVKTAIRNAKANPWLTAGAVVAGLAVADSAQYGFKAFRNNRKAKALPVAVTVNETDYTAAVTQRDAADAELKAVQAKVALAQLAKSKIEADAVEYDAKLKGKVDAGQKPTKPATVKTNKKKRQIALDEAIAALNTLTAQQTELVAKFVPLATKVTDLEAQKTAAQKTAADAKALTHAQATNGLYAVRAPKALWASVASKFKKTDASTPATPTTK